MYSSNNIEVSGLELTTIVNGVENGLFKSWWANGQMSYRYNHKNGSLVGKYDSWWSNGKLCNRKRNS